MLIRMLPDRVTSAELARISSEVGAIRGWDWSRLRVVRDPIPFDYVEIVRDIVRTGDRVLDIGTGGAEVLLALELATASTVAIDHQLSMALVARDRIASSSRTVQLAAADAGALPFPGECFDRVLCRHATADPPEVARVLRPGGVYVNQGVGARNTQSLFDALGWGSNWEQFSDDALPPRDRHVLAAEFEAFNCRTLRIDEYEVGHAFADVESLIFFLQNAPFPNRFDPDRHVDNINTLLEHHRSERGIETTEHRELLIVERSQ
jgi:SAM-dependent methyltransferase